MQSIFSRGELTPTTPNQRPTPAFDPRYLVVVAVAVLAVRLGDVLLENRSMLGDFPAYYRAATNVRQGMDLYAEARLLLQHNAYDFWAQTDGQYVYPPLLAVLLVPFTALSLEQAAGLWLAGLLTATGGVAWAIIHLLGRPRWSAPLAAVAPVAIPFLAAEPLLLGLKYRQPDIVLLLLAVLALISGIGGQEVRAGVLLGVAVAIKPTWALYALFFLRKRWWTATAVAAATGGVLGLAPFALVAGDEFRSWLAVGSYYGSGDYAAYPHNQSVNGVLLRAFVGSPLGPPILESPVAARGLWVGAVIGAIWLWSTLVSAAPAAGPRAAAEFAATVVLVLFASPLSEDIHFAVVVLPLAVLLDHCVWAAPPRWWGALAVATCAYFAQPLLEQIFYWEWTTVQRIVMGIIYLAGLLLVAVALVRLLRSPVRGTVRTRELQSFGRTGTFLRRRSGPV